MLRKDQVVRGDAARGQHHDPLFEKDYPTLYAHLTQVRWEDGTPRQLSSFGVYPDGPIVRVVVRDPNRGLMCWVTVDRLSEMLRLVEAALADPHHEWRVDRKQPGEKARRVPAPEPPPNGVDKRRSKR